MTPTDHPRLDAGHLTGTRWSVVVQAGCADTAVRLEALETLCQIYWYPLYCFARRLGSSPEDAEDLTQSFFAFVLEQGTVARADRDRGRFRTFLLSSFRNFLANEWKRARTARRGGGRQALPLESLSAADRYALEVSTTETPDTAYDRAWAAALLQQALARLRDEYVSGGKGDVYEALKLRLWSEREGGSYTQAAERLGLSEAAVKMAAMRLRRRFREAIQREVEQTVAAPAQVEEEMRDLLKLLRG